MYNTRARPDFCMPIGPTCYLCFSGFLVLDVPHLSLAILAIWIAISKKPELERGFRASSMRRFLPGAAAVVALLCSPVFGADFVQLNLTSYFNAKAAATSAAACSIQRPR